MNPVLRPVALALMTTLVTSVAMLSVQTARADERMAGTQPSAAPQQAESATEPKQDKAAPKSAEAAPAATAGEKAAPVEASPQEAARIITPPKPVAGEMMDRRALESLGPLTNPLRGGLGNDMWADTPRSVVQDFLPLLPDGQTIWPAQWLARRVILSNGDVTMMKNDKSPQDGEDLFTLRLERLLAMGAYADAASLYKLIEGNPLHDRMVRAGILALLQNGQVPQACLEALATKDKPSLFENDLFWPQIDGICSYAQAQSARSIKESGFTKINLQALDQLVAREIPGSKVLSTLVGRDNYRHNISSADDMAELTTLERAVLRGMGRFDYSRLKLKKLHTVSAPVLMTMASDPNMTPNLRLALNIEAAERGLITPDQLGTLYKTLAEGPGAPGLTVSYANASKAENQANRTSIVAGLLNGERRQALPTALLPFAGMVNEVNPAGLSLNALENGLLVMLQAGITPSEKWVSSWLAADSADSRKSRETVLLYLANLVPENLPTNSEPFTAEQLNTVFKPEITKDSLILWAVFSGLGRADQLHNIDNPDAYEKHLDLTVPTDYVMPSGSLMEKIRDAAQNGRLGETALLASVALNSDNLEKIHPGVIQEVLKSLETVGLKEEARNMALGVILSLKQ